MGLKQVKTVVIVVASMLTLTACAGSYSIPDSTEWASYHYDLRAKKADVKSAAGATTAAAAVY